MTRGRFAQTRRDVSPLETVGNGSVLEFEAPYDPAVHDVIIVPLMDGAECQLLVEAMRSDDVVLVTKLIGWVSPEFRMVRAGPRVFTLESVQRTYDNWR